MNNTAYISIPSSDLAGFSESTKTELSEYLFERQSELLNTKNSHRFSDVEQEELPVDLTPALLKKFTKNISEKTTKALKIISSSETPEFHLSDVVKSIDGAESYMDLRAVWAGITKRTRTITKDKEATLIVWGEWIEDKDGNNDDVIGEISVITHNSLKAFFA